MNRWYTSDNHFGHNKLVDSGYRPFESVQQMNDAMIGAWNSLVDPEDEVWVLGDLAMRPHDLSLEAAAQLHGRKILVPGNHDECWRGKRENFLAYKAIGRQALYTRLAGFAAIVDRPRPHMIAGEAVELSHFPYEADHTSKPRYPEHRPVDAGGWLLHGHIHDMWRQHDKQINVGVDAWAMRPVHVDEIAELIAAGPADRAPLPMREPAAV